MSDRQAPMVSGPHVSVYIRSLTQPSTYTGELVYTGLPVLCGLLDTRRGWNERSANE